MLERLGVERARQVVIDCWNAIQHTDSSVRAVSHSVTVAYQFSLSMDEYKRVLGNFAKIPPGLPSQSQVGIVYYLPPEDSGPLGSIVLDRLLTGDLNVRITMLIDANKVSLDALGPYIDEYCNKILNMIDLEIERGE